MRAKQPFDVTTGLCTHLLHHAAAAAEHDGLLRVSLNVHCRLYVERLPFFAGLHLQHLHRYGVGELLLGDSDELLPNELGYQGLLGLVGHGIRREIQRSLRQ